MTTARRKQIVRQRTGEVAKAGRMFFEALFSPTPGKFFEEKGAELERELGERGAIVVDGELLDDDEKRRR
ncbi:MAG TPA: hypothetical protein VGG39_13015 [Polyangiaceae bacterium]